MRWCSPLLAIGLIWVGSIAGCADDDGAVTLDDGGSDAQQQNNNENDRLPKGPWFPPCAPGARTQTVTLVHAGDLHAHYNPRDSESPLARLRGYYEQVRAENPYTLLTDGGDAYEKGSVAELISAGASTREMMHAARFDVRVLGNHDFAWGPQEVLAYSRDPHAMMLASNTAYVGSDPGGFGGVDWAELQVGCLRVGFLGMVSRPWNEQNEQYDGDYLPGFHTRHDYVNVARDLVVAHRSEVDLVVMVSHLGVRWDEAIAWEVHGIHAILGGHSHTTLYAPLYIDGTAVVHAGAYGEHVARLDLVMDLDSGAVIDRRYVLRENRADALPLDGELERSIEEILARHAPGYDLPVGTLTGDRSRDEVAVLAARAAVDGFELDGALVDVEEVWQGLPRGGVSPQDLADSFPVERQPADTPGFSSFYAVTLCGADLQRLRQELDPGRWAVLLPTDLDAEAAYRVALQKHVAFDPDDQLPPGAFLSHPVALSEVWAALEAYARKRTGQCLHLDADSPIPGCR